MVVVLFLLSLVVTGLVLSTVPSKQVVTHTDVDYHIVPFAG